MTNPEPIWAMGLMTGTVVDGNIDIALLKTDGERVVEVGPFVLTPYAPDIVNMLIEALDAALQWQFSGDEPAIFAQVERALTLAQSQAVLQFLQSIDMPSSDIAVVGFHGQSVLHRAPVSGRLGKTRQLGDGSLMSRMLGIPVVYDFRSADVNAGGQGAPLAAVYHAALLGQLPGQLPGNLNGQITLDNTAILNLGGVANLTWTDHRGQLIAFDTGPANAPLNDFISAHNLGRMDRDGLIATQGHVDEVRLLELLQHPYLIQSYPKSLDRFDFTAHMAKGCGLEDGAALLTAFTAAAVGKGLDLLPSRPDNLIVCGGGRHNPTLMLELEQRAEVKALLAEEVGWHGDAIEAECFAFLAVRFLRNLPISFPSTTGACTPVCGGQLASLV